MSHMMQTNVELMATTERVSMFVRNKEIFFECSEIRSPSCDFAIWGALPIAMRFGGTLRVAGATSARARANAERLSLIWSTWLPKLFKPVRVQSDGYVEPEAVGGSRELMLFSGGVDSTFALKRHALEVGQKPDLLTIHGMDYNRADADGFQRLQKKTEDFRRNYSGSSLEVKSNAASVMRRFGISSAIGHGFQLFSTLFLFDDVYRHGLISSDFNKPQDFLSLPWGTNSLTNPMFAGSRMKIISLSDDVTRGDKVAALRNDAASLQSLSFCKNRSVRPDNCGICSKCVRTKAMFYATGGDVPDIFKVSGFQQSDLRFLDISKAIEVAFVMDVLDQAERSGRIQEFKELNNLLYSGIRPSKLGRLLRKGEAIARGMIASKSNDL